jgi:ATP adenylyltransferase
MAQSSFDTLRHFITSRMRMSHIYQPLMLKTMLERGGSASIRQIATAFLNEDESQVEYYEQIVKNMPGRVLAKHAIVERTGDRFRLDTSVATLTKPERAKLATLCQEAIAKFKAARGAAIWEHRRPGLGIIPGRQRYETLKAAGFRCELCGVSADERALDVDHILPRKHGGTDDSENLQALCWKCNGDKGAGDDADLRQVRVGYAARQQGCPFCDLRAIRVVADNALALLIRDAFPVTPGHLLAIPRRHVGTWFDLHRPEQHAVNELVRQGRVLTRNMDRTVAGFNVGINDGDVAGQTVPHCHVHLIPRRAADVENPRGGVRNVIPGKGDYSVSRGERSRGSVSS